MFEYPLLDSESRECEFEYPLLDSESRECEFEYPLLDSESRECEFEYPLLDSESSRDLARNEEFSEIAVINIFLQFSKQKHSYLWGGGPAGKISR